MKSTQLKKEVSINNYLLKLSTILGLIGFASWVLLFLVFDPLAGLYKIGKFDIDLSLFSDPNLYIQSLFVGFLFFVFFYLTLKHKDKSKSAKVIMWAGIVLYALFYLGYLFMLFFFRFTDL